MSELEIAVSELQRRRKAGETFLLVDVREQWEYDLCRIDGARLIPMRTIPANLQLLDGDEDVICYCHHGQRSLDVAAWLRAQRALPRAGHGSKDSFARGSDPFDVQESKPDQKAGRSARRSACDWPGCDR